MASTSHRLVPVLAAGIAPAPAPLCSVLLCHPPHTALPSSALHPSYSHTERAQAQAQLPTLHHSRHADITSLRKRKRIWTVDQPVGCLATDRATLRNIWRRRKVKMRGCLFRSPDRRALDKWLFPSRLACIGCIGFIFLR